MQVVQVMTFKSNSNLSHAGGRRIITVPSDQGFGESGGNIAATLHAPNKQGTIPSDATLIYDLELIRVSIPPS